MNVEMPNYKHAPDVSWPGIAKPGHPTPEEAKARLRPRGVHTPEDLGMTSKQAHKMVSYATKGHLKSNFKARRLGKTKHKTTKRHKRKTT